MPKILSVSQALVEMANECRENTQIVPSKVGLGPTKEARDRYRETVEGVAGELGVLGAAALERRVERNEFIAIEAKYKALFPLGALKSHSWVQTAFARQGTS